MSNTEEVRSLEDESIIERWEEYDHATYGRVTVTGIWKGVHRVDKARNTNDTGIIIVRYSTDQNEGRGEADELTDTLDEFLAAIE